jgi:hypothetical protein
LVGGGGTSLALRGLDGTRSKVEADEKGVVETAVVVGVTTLVGGPAFARRGLREHVSDAQGTAASTSRVAVVVAAVRRT